MAAANSSYLLWKKSLIYGGGIIGTGVLLYKFTTPTEEQLIARLSPELRQEYEQNKSLRRKEQEELMKIVRETSKSNDPIWKTGPLTPSWESSATGPTDRLPKGKELLVAKQAFEKSQAEEKQKEELRLLKKQVEETSQLESSKGSKWKFW
ncbi:Cytochrome bc1 complex assembly factor [Komagataella phaffii CBS 7435]|uniref:Cytochrome b mRNA-processing protein 4 n=2 Tax=Komagataella phaffii TaxID=460519 RepID=C4R3L7_KOMPG|nr:Mitochondrial protein required for assembly of ubiquinol cytochrome-c reductase complex (cytochrome [Komagataella phaffii GS115]AOA64170.1 GQ67_03138T0 [Komagataella phaffii]CAH2450203.1 Cytochrome bc1 complex assembly factor [Komagataella phaffii CBS 7435]AOA68670.1 GQ68_03122T0 [Komagataella phaffii GS115]CAY70058.1 Mitochondrial protein required for assembly of ubiquinol cytochrome-c reductase complex (cytochrome [Komagataella phaffii GS115]CCA40056.1 Cytochrome bc1 complex assembly fact